VRRTHRKPNKAEAQLRSSPITLKPTALKVNALKLNNRAKAQKASMNLSHYS
jgi:hypothetical protein